MKQMLMLAGAIACGFSAWADIPTCTWFSAVPGGTISGGDWNPAPCATNTSGTAYWEVDTDGVSDAAVFKAQSIEANGMTTRVTSTLSFTSAYSSSALPAPSDDAQAGLVVGLDSTTTPVATNYYGLVAASGDTNYQWVKLTGATPPVNLDTTVTVKINVNYGVSPITVTYMIGDTALVQDGTSTSALTRRSVDATQVSEVCYAGYSKIQNIAGTVDAAATMGSTPCLTFAKAVTNYTASSTITLYKDAAYTFDVHNKYTINKNGKNFTPSYAAAGFSNTDVSGDTVTCLYHTSQVYTGGSGTSESPYQIANLCDLKELAYFTKNGNTTADKYFQQTAAITLSGEWNGIGAFDAKGNLEAPATYTAGAFKGHYDGGNYQISNLILQRGDYVGFFGSTYGASIKNVKISLGNATGFGEAGNGTAGSSSGANYGGGAIVGVSVNTTLENCQTIAGTYNNFVGTKGLAGIVGYACGGTVLSNCVNNINVRTADEEAGGLIACAQDNANYEQKGVIIDTCTNNGNVECSTSGKTRVGGLVSYADNTNTFKGKNVVNCTLTQNGGVGYSVISPNSGTVVLADDATFTVPAAYQTICSGKAVDGLFFATTSGDTATLIKNSAVVAGGSYKIMADGAPDITLPDPTSGTSSITLATNFYNYVGTVAGTLYKFIPAAAGDNTATYSATYGSSSSYKTNAVDVAVGSSSGKIVIPAADIVKIDPNANLTTEEGREAFSAKLNAKGGNNQKVWESYMMGIDKDATPTMAATQDTDKGNLTVSLKGLAPKVGQGATVTYQVSGIDGVFTEPTFTIPLNTSGAAQMTKTITVTVTPSEVQ